MVMSKDMGGSSTRGVGGIGGAGGRNVNPKYKETTPKIVKDLEKSLKSGFTIQFGNGPVKQIKPQK